MIEIESHGMQHNYVSFCWTDMLDALDMLKLTCLMLVDEAKTVQSYTAKPVRHKNHSVVIFAMFS